MSNKIKDETFSKLSFDSYEDSLLKVGSVIRTVDGKFVVINSIDKESGLQAVAVVNQADYDKIQNGGQPDNIIFVSRGSSELKDWTTNFNQLGTNLSVDKIKENSSKTQYVRFIAENASNTIKNPIISHSLTGWSKGSASDNHQFIEYEKWVNKVVNNRKPADYSFTGHSLGGALAQFMGVMNNKNATTFAAARCYRILPKKYRDLVDQGYYNNRIRDYRHELDPVGFVPLGKTIGKRFLVLSNSAKFPVVGHMNKSFSGIFNSDGSIKIFYDPSTLNASGRDFINLSESLLKTLRQLQNFEEREGMAIMNLMKSIQNGLNGGCYSELSDSDVTEVIQSVFPFCKGNTPSTYNTDVSLELKANIKKASQNIRKIGIAMQNSATKAVDEDRAEANSFKL